MIQKEEKNEIGTLLAVICFLCNISQMPQLMGNAIIKYSYLGLWLILFFILIFKNARFSLSPIINLIVFDVLCILSILVTGVNGYLNSNLFYPIHLSAFVLVVGIMSGRYLTFRDLKKIAGAFILSSFLAAIVIYFDVFRGSDWAGSGSYLYSSKNSAGQIFLTAIILLVLLFYQEHKFLTVFGTLFFLALIFMMKSRTTILSAIAIILYITFFVIQKKRYKLIIGLLLAAGVILIFSNKALYQLFIEEIMLRNKEVTDITGITSERDLHFEYFSKMFPEYWLHGTGGTYIESFPLACLLSYGVIKAIPIFLFSFYPLYVAIKYRKRKDLKVLSILIIALNVMMWFNGIFEELSPFGPGVKCYFLWSLTGFWVGIIQSKKEFC